MLSEIPGTVIFLFSVNQNCPNQLIFGSVQLLSSCHESYWIKWKKAVQHVGETIVQYFMFLLLMYKKKLVDEDFSGRVWTDVIIKSI